MMKIRDILNQAVVTAVCYLYVCLVDLHATAGLLIEQPKNTVAMLDKVATVKCRSNENLELQWHTFGHDPHEVELWTGYELNPDACPPQYCRIDNHEIGEYNLNITARKETAKQYICTEPGTLETVCASLVVIKSNMTCKSSEIGSDVTLACAIGFYGEWAPQINWVDSNGNQMKDAVPNEETEEITSTLTMPVTSEEVHYIASVIFSKTERPAKVTAENVPSYTDKWTSPSFKRNASHSASAPTIIVGLFVCIIGLLVITGFLLYRKWSFRKRIREIARREVESAQWIQNETKYRSDHRQSA